MAAGFARTIIGVALVATREITPALLTRACAGVVAGHKNLLDSVRGGCFLQFIQYKVKKSSLLEFLEASKEIIDRTNKFIRRRKRRSHMRALRPACGFAGACFRLFL